MYTNLILYRNELKNKNVPKYKMLGIIAELLLSKQVFPHNSNIQTFIEDVFGIQFKPYLLKSRTLVVARISREILTLENENVYKKKLYRFIEGKIDEMKKEDDKKNDFNGWIK